MALDVRRGVPGKALDRSLISSAVRTVGGYDELWRQLAVANPDSALSEVIP